jgi:hypothetical protein
MESGRQRLRRCLTRERGRKRLGADLAIVHLHPGSHELQLVGPLFLCRRYQTHVSSKRLKVYGMGGSSGE